MLLPVIPFDVSTVPEPAVKVPSLNCGGVVLCVASIVTVGAVMSAPAPTETLMCGSVWAVAPKFWMLMAPPDADRVVASASVMLAATTCTVDEAMICDPLSPSCASIVGPTRACDAVSWPTLMTPPVAVSKTLVARS